MLKDTVVVMPARNESATIGRVLHQVRRDVDPQAIIVVDDGSTDDTASLAKKHGARVLQTGNDQGALGDAMNYGIRTGLEAGFNWFLIIDADDQYRPADLLHLHARLVAGDNDLMVGNRLSAGRPDGMTPPRFYLNRMFSSALGGVLGLRADLDAQSGMRAFGSGVAERSLGTNPFTYTQEQILRAAMAGFSVGSAPVRFGPRPFGKSRLVTSTVDYAARTVPHLIRVHSDRPPMPSELAPRRPRVRGR